jgi:tripartite motif-containing protein 71
MHLARTRPTPRSPLPWSDRFRKMPRIVWVIFLLCGLLFACASERPQIGAESPAILDLQLVKVLGPVVGSDRALSSPRDIAINRLKEIYIADYGNDRIVKLDSTFAFVKEVGGFGASSYSLNGPLSIALDNVSNVYVVDSGNARVVMLDRYLNFISAESGFTRDEKIKFIRPQSIDISTRGDIYIGDEGLGACYKLDPFFSYVQDFGSREQVQPVGYPAGIFCDRNGKIYVADSDYGKIYVFDDFGLLLRTFGADVLRKPASVITAPSTGIWVTDSDAAMLYCFDSKGREQFRWNGQGQTIMKRPAGLCADDSGKIYVVDSQANRIFITKPIPGQ